jgi:hypothetical protein
MVWVGSTPYSFEAVRDCLTEAERTFRECPTALCATLVAWHDREPLDHYRNCFPADHPWLTDLAAGAFALVFAPIFYRLHDGVPIRIADAVDGLDYDMETHRRMLRLILEG